MSYAAMLVVAMGLDAALGWPDWLFRRAGHPVTWMGAAISMLDQRLNRDSGSFAQRRMMGVLTAGLVIALVTGVALVVQSALPQGWRGVLIGGVLAWPLVAMRSMHDHVRAVERPLLAQDLTGARAAVAMIVGRDPDQLDAAGVARAALESLAENTSDGIVAPLFWGAIFGLPGIAAYKAINTMDSMIGHKSPRFQAFGWAAARIDDVVNLIPARATGLIFAALSSRPGRAFSVMWRDARQHRSPNAGWPESAMAGALGVRLSGPRAYGEGVRPEPWINSGEPDPTPLDLSAGLDLYVRAMLAIGLILLIVSAI